MHKFFMFANNFMITREEKMFSLTRMVREKKAFETDTSETYPLKC